ncbi:hypothetical protein BGZ94_009789 [Podila epigama]|nr:hypothetical protein BGZ94_009789 [Podila epigama]
MPPSPPSGAKVYMRTCYPLGYPSRADFDINTKYTYLVQDRRPDAPVCQPGRQNIPGNNPFPAGSVYPGQTLHLTWQPDGHLDDAKPSTVEVHWTGVPGTRLWTRSELNPSTLLGTMTFATSGNCDQPGEPNTWCHGYITIPQGTQPGSYQLVWWWKYDRNPAGEEYSTCFELNVAGDATIQARGDSSDQTPEAKIQSESKPEESAVVVEPAPEVAAAPAIASDDSVAPAAAAASLQAPPSPANSFASESAPQMEQIQEPSSFTNSAPVKGSTQSDSLADLSVKTDEPLAVVPAVGVQQEVKQELAKGSENINDKEGALAGDAINDSASKDATPDLLDAPLQALQNLLKNGTSTSPNATESLVNVRLNGTALLDLLNDTAPLSTTIHPQQTNHTSNLVSKGPIDSSATMSKSGSMTRVIAALSGVVTVVGYVLI